MSTLSLALEKISTRKELIERMPDFAGHLLILDEKNFSDCYHELIAKSVELDLYTSVRQYCQMQFDEAGIIDVFNKIDFAERNARFDSIEVTAKSVTSGSLFKTLESYEFESEYELETCIASFRQKAKILHVTAEFDRLAKSFIKSKSKSSKPVDEYSGNSITQEIVETALSELGMSVSYNMLLKENEYSGLPGEYSQMAGAETVPVIIMDYLKQRKVKGCNQNIITAYLSCIADKNRFNPITDYLKDAEWDGTDRIEELCDIAGIKEEKYKTYVRKWLIQCVALAFNDFYNPVSAEGVLVLQGAQGIAKTSFFRKITPSARWFAEGKQIDMAVKDTIIVALSSWICELGELDSTIKKEQAALKAFITSPEDRIRLPYGKTALRFPRMTSFCGTVNPKNYLKDETGSRRFWTIPLTYIDKKRLFAIKDEWVHQLWGQVYAEYKKNPKGYLLTESELNRLNIDNTEFEQKLPFEIEIREKFEDIPFEKWSWWKASDFTHYISGNASAYQVGRVFTKCLKEWEIQKIASADSLKRISRGVVEYKIPFKHLNTDKL